VKVFKVFRFLLELLSSGDCTFIKELTMLFVRGVVSAVFLFEVEARFLPIRIAPRLRILLRQQLTRIPLVLAEDQRYVHPHIDLGLEDIVVDDGPVNALLHRIALRQGLK